jgi:Tc toxin complex TcA C-terminal TcB-binding domain/Neuraminidase-like domain/Salmonella virulence plasmid 28.1kDa A protein/Hemopexin
MMSAITTLPSYIELFGNADTTSGDEARSVLSPAAYFVDLMLLKEKQGAVLEDLDIRRPDLSEIPLNRENTFSEISYLDVANEIMAARIEKASQPNPSGAYEILKSAVYPYPAPFDKDYQQVRESLKYHRSDLVEFYKKFLASPDSERVAREFLGLTQTVYDLLITPAVTADTLKARWGLKAEDALEKLHEVSTLVQQAGLSGKAFQELLFQNLSERELEQGLAKDFFINDGTSYIKTNVTDPANPPANPKLILSDDQTLTPEHLDRIQRLIYLARVLGWSLTDCDWVLRTACAKRIDAAAIQKLAIIQYLYKKYEIALDELGVLWANLKNWGEGPTTVPAHLFYRTFDQGYSTRILAADFLTLSSTATESEKSQLSLVRNRVQASLKISETDLTLLLESLTPYLEQQHGQVKVTVSNLSSLYRFTQLAKLLELSLAELLSLCNLLDKLQLLQGSIAFETDVPLEEKAPGLQSQAILSRAAEGELAQLFWLLQTLSSVVDWLNRLQLSVLQLAFICQTEIISGVEDVLRPEEQADLFASLAEAFEPLLVKPAALQSSRLDLSSANQLHELLARLETGVLSQSGLVGNLPSSSAALPENIRQVMYTKYPLRQADFAAWYEEAGAFADFLDDLEIKQSIRIQTESEGIFTEKGREFFSNPDSLKNFKPKNYSAAEAEVVAKAEAIVKLIMEKVQRLTVALADASDETHEVIYAKYPLRQADFAAWYEEAGAFADFLDDLEIKQSIRIQTESEGIFTEKGREFFSNPDSLTSFKPKNFSTAEAAAEAEKIVKLLMEKVQRLTVDLAGAGDEAQALLEKLTIALAQQTQALLSTLESSLGLDQEILRLLVRVVYTTAAESERLIVARFMNPILASSAGDESQLPEIASNFHRLQQLALIINKTELTAQQIQVFLAKENFSLNKPEKMGFPNWTHYDGLFRDPAGDYYLTSAAQYAKYSGQDYHLQEQKRLAESDELNQLPDPFTQKIDTGFEDLAGNTYLFSGDKFIQWNQANPRPEVQRISLRWGLVDNEIIRDKKVDAAYRSASGKFYLFRHDQYVRYSDIEQTYVDEGYPKKIKDNWNQEGHLLLPSLFNQGLSAILEDEQGEGYFFLGKDYLNSRKPESLGNIAPDWGRVFNRIVAENAIDGVVMIGGKLYLFRQDQYVRYSTSDYSVVDISYPLRIWANWSKEGLGDLPAVLQEPWPGIIAGFQGVDGKIYLFPGKEQVGKYFVLGAGTELLAIESQWGRVRNNIEQLQRIDAALHLADKTYLFSGDQYTLYSGTLRPGAADFYVVEGYPKKIAVNWNMLENLGTLPEAFTSGLQAALAAPDEKIYYFKGESYSSSATGTQEWPIAEHWGRVRNEMEIRQAVDAAFTWENKFYLCCGDQFFRYTQETQEYVDEGYPQTLVGSLSAEGHWSTQLPEKYGQQGLSAAFRTPENKLCLFSGSTFVTSADFSQEQPIYPSWGKVRNLIQAPAVGKRSIDAAFSYGNKTYLFSGDQCFRYTGSAYDYADDGYPQKLEQVFGGLPNSFRQSINMAFTFTVASQPRLYLFCGDNYVRYTDMTFKQIDSGYPRAIATGNLVEGSLFSYLTTIDTSKNYTAFVPPVGGKEWLYLFYYVAGKNTHYFRNYYYNGTQSVWSEEMTAASYLQQHLTWSTIDLAFYGHDGKVHYFYQTNWAARAWPHISTDPKPAAVSITEKWGIIQNRFTELQRVDAVYQAANQKVYLFCDTQFIRYSQVINPGAEDFYVDDGYPRTIANGWEGEGTGLVIPTQFAPGNKYVFCLTPAGKTIVFTPDTYQIQGEMSEPQPLLNRWGKVENHFTQVDAAYVAANGKTYLFRKHQFIRYSGAITPEAEHFYVDESYPKTIATAWEAEGCQLTTLPAEFKPEGYALVRTEETSYLFEKANYWSAAQPQPQTLSAHWGRVRNHIQERRKLDTAAVLTLGSQKYTYLISDDQYVRYSQDYRDYVDESYPKTIATHWEAETGLALPSSYQQHLQGIFQDATGKLYAFAAQSFVTSDATVAEQPIQLHWGLVRNLIQAEERIDAAYHHVDKTYLFRGDQYVRYSEPLAVGEADFYVDEGYPRPLVQFGEVEGSFSLPEQFHPGVDAAFNGAHGEVYFLKDNYSFRSDKPGEVQALEARWGQVYNQFTLGNKIDAAFQGLDGKYYLFYRDQYICYDDLTQLGSDEFYVTEGYPKKIVDNLGKAWPAYFQADLDAAWVLEGRTYLFKGTQYLRFSEPLCRIPDELAASGDIATAWQNRPLLLLRDVVKIDQFQQLTNTYNEDEYPLLRYFQEKAYQLADLSRATGWEQTELNMVSFGASLDDLGDLTRINQLMTYGEKLGSKVSTLKNELWGKLFLGSPDYPAASQLLIGLLKAKNSAPDWAILSPELQNKLNLAKRNALMPYLMHLLEMKTSRELYAELLMDMEMSECATTSRIVNAIATTQLFYHRSIINLEAWEDELQAKLTDLKKWWGWMKNYRVWEANRRVFLYPENYIRPELRSSKSPAFQKLEEELLQTDITDAAVEIAYKNYLDEYAIVSSLVIAGGYVYRKDNDTYTMMFGYSRTQPLKYYYRIGKIGKGEGDPIDWEPWLELGIQINSEKVYPVYAFNRLFVFWVELKEINETEFSATMKEPISSKNAKLNYQPVIYYSFYNLNHNWIVPQKVVEVKKDPVTSWLRSDLDEARFSVTNPSKKKTVAEYDPQEYIYLSYRLFYGWGEELAAGKLTSELEYKPGPEPHLDRLLPKLSFSDLGITAARYSQWGGYFGQTISTPWFSINAKGGNFLCQPTVVSQVDTDIQVLSESEEAFKTLSQIDAGFEDKAGKLYLFSGPDYYVVENNQLSGPKPIRDYWGKIHTDIFTTQNLRHAFTLVGQTYFITNQEVYFSYSQTDYATDKLLHPRPRSQFKLSELLSKYTQESWENFWKDPVSKLSNAFILGDSLYLLAEAEQVYSTHLVTELLTITPYKDLGQLDAAFVVDSVLYITGGDNYIAYEGSWSQPQRIQPAEPTEARPWGKEISRILAGFKGLDGKQYFFSDKEYTDPDPNNNFKLQALSNLWGKVYTNIFSTTDEQVANIFTLGEKTYVVTPNYYFTYTQGNYQYYDELNHELQYQPRSQLNLANLLAAGNFSRQDWRSFLPNLALVLNHALMWEGQLYLFAGTIYTSIATSGLLQQLRDSQRLENQVVQSLEVAWVEEGKLYLIVDGNRFTVLSQFDLQRLLYTWQPWQIFFYQYGSTDIRQVNTQEGRVYVLAPTEYTSLGTKELGQLLYSNGHSISFASIQNIAQGKLDNSTLVVTTTDNQVISVSSYLWPADARGNSSDDYPYPADGISYSRYAWRDFFVHHGNELSGAFEANGRIYLEFRGITQVWNSETKAWENRHTYTHYTSLRKIELVRWLYLQGKLSSDTVGITVSASGETLTINNTIALTSSTQWYAWSPLSSLDRLELPAIQAQANQPRIWGEHISHISAAFKGLDGHLYCFDGHSYADPEAKFALKPVAAKWGYAPNLLTSGIDAAVVDIQNRLYFFRGEYNLVYPSLTAQGPKEYDGYPKRILARWDLGGLSPEVYSAFNYQGKVYLLKEGQYLRYSNGHRYPDSGYPRDFKGYWGNLIDYYNDGKIEAGFKWGNSFYLFYRDPESGNLTYTAYALTGEEQKLPYELLDVKYAIVRLTSNTAQRLSQKLFAQGVPGLLALASQQEEELPKVTQKPESEYPLDTLYCSQEKFLPFQSSNYLDFGSTNANGSYYWEIFFHTPYLVAQALNQAQKFAEAQKWYQYVYDPTEPSTKTNPAYWKFLPFHDDLDQPADWNTQLDKYRDDPFDPHGIARLRPIAYRKALVMSYIDNLLDWGDLLFQQYTRETITEARMLYILAYDLLGQRPENLGVKELTPTQTYRQIYAGIYYPASVASASHSAVFLLLELENAPANATLPAVSTAANTETPHDNFVALDYFFIPENEFFVQYWDRVEDRLYKIRHCLNIEGIKQPLALFEPPLDPMALVQAAAGGGLSQALASFNVAVPHYRFNYMLAKVREFTGHVIQLGSTLLGTLEKKDAEDLGLLRNTQEKSILTMSLEIKEKQLENVMTSLASLQTSLKSAQERQNHYQKLLDDGLSAQEKNQVEKMKLSRTSTEKAEIWSNVASKVSLIANAGAPTAMTYGGVQLSSSLEGIAAAIRSQAGRYDFESSLSATLGGWDRRSQDWGLQKKLATHDTEQIGYQIAGTQIQIQIAQKEIEVQKKQIKHNEDIDNFLRSKFTNKQLYQWMAGKLAGVYFQSYQMALELAKGLQRAFQFELGLKESEVNFITSVYWDSLHKGLLAGEQLQKDLDRMEKAYLEKNHRRFEISKTLALSQIAPLALLRLKQKRDCEFTLTENLFDYDFPGHYCRQIKSISISFPAIVGQYQNLNATLTQLSHHTLIEPDKKGVNYLLLQPTDEMPPLSIRSDWRAHQQVALSRGENDSGLFQLNFQDERYLPFEGTGAISTWRLELSGIEGLIDLTRIQDVIIQLNYTALPGGESFANEVKSKLPATEQAKLFLLKQDFSEAWQQFMQSPADGITFTLTSEQLPYIKGDKIQGLYLQYSLTKEGEKTLGEAAMKLVANKILLDFKPLSYLENNIVQSIKINQSWQLSSAKPSDVEKFTPENLRDIALVVVYTAKVKV